MSKPDALKRILILDDDGDFRRLLKVYLAKLLPGVEVVEYDPVARGAPGDDFDWTPYDALILDYYLCIHNVTGLDILQRHRKNKFFPATIMMTGAGNEEVAVRALRAGVYDYLRKEKFDKEQLKQSLLSAVEKHQVERARLLEQTNHTRAFNKALFYQELEQGDDAGTSRERALLLVEVDEHQVIEERFGVIIRDNIVRHLARQCYEFFKSTNVNPHVTRINDQSVALLINAPETFDALHEAVGALCSHLQQNPYTFEEKKLRFTVSIGVVPVPRTGRSAATLLATAKECVGMAAIREGNSFHVFMPRTVAAVEEEVIPEPGTSTEPAPAPATPAAESPAAAPEAGLPREDIGDRTLAEPLATPHQVSAPEPAATPQPAPAAPPRAAPAAPRPTAPPAGATPAPARTGGGPAPAAAPAKPVAATPRPPARPTESAPAPARAPAPPAHPPTTSAPAASAPPGKAPATAAPPARAEAPAKDESELDEATLDPAALRIRKAFTDNRITQLFRPMISLVNEGAEGERETYRVNLQFVDTDGRQEDEAAIYTAASAPSFRKFIDRWLLRETMGRVVNREPGRFLFLLRLSESSLADPGLFNWLRKLLAGLDKQQPGKSIALEIAAADFAELEKPAAALMTYLHKSHGFRFALGQVTTAEAARLALKQTARFDMILINLEILRALAGDNGAEPAVLDQMRTRGQRLVVDGIEDATSLTDAIALGADYAMGRFVGEPVQQIDEATSSAVELG